MGVVTFPRPSPYPCTKTYTIAINFPFLGLLNNAIETGGPPEVWLVCKFFELFYQSLSVSSGVFQIRRF